MSAAPEVTLPAPPAGPRPHRSRARATSMFEPAILSRAVGDAGRKLSPRQMARNPVMFVVELGSVVTTFLFLRDLRHAGAADTAFAVLVAVCLWLTVIFPNLAQPVAAGRRSAQPAPRASSTPRPRRAEATHAAPRRTVARPPECS